MKKILFCALLASVLTNPALAGFDEGIAAYEAGNLPVAFREFHSAAGQGDAGSQFNVGLMYEQGIGVGKDEMQAVDWYRKAAGQGVSSAQYNLAVLYENGRGTAVDFAQANAWYRKAAEQGDAFAIGNLGMLFVRGEGVKQNKIAGVALLMVSATMDGSPGNRARQNLATTRGLTTPMIQAAQQLSAELSKPGQLLTALDQYLEKAEAN